MFLDNSIPRGSPLVQYRPRSIPTINVTAPASPLATISPRAPSGVAQQLPAPPPSKLGRKPTVWDQDHISETLARIGAGFFSSQNFGEGLGAAASSIADRTRDLRAERVKSVSYGGPDDQFEITTNPDGTRVLREVPEFRAAVDRKREAAKALSPKDAADFRARAVYAISQLPVEQRQAAYADLIQNPSRYMVDTTGMPAEWSDTYGQVGGSMGMNVNQAETAEARAAAAEARKAAEEVRRIQRDRGLSQRDRQLDQADRRETRLRSAPPSTRKPRSGTLAIGTSMGGYTYQGGDPHDRANWSK